VGIFPEGKDSRGDHGLGRLVEFRFKGPPGTTSYINTHRDNVSAPYGRPNFRSRLHSCHVQEGGPRSPQGHVVALEKKHLSPSCLLFLKCDAGENKEISWTNRVKNKGLLQRIKDGSNVAHTMQRRVEEG